MKLMQTVFAGVAGALFAIAAQAADITGAGSTFAAPITRSGPTPTRSRAAARSTTRYRFVGRHQADRSRRRSISPARTRR